MKKLSIVALSIITAFSVAGCTQGGSTEEVTIMDKTANSIYGQLSDFSDNTKAGETLTFKVTPAKYFHVEGVTNNGRPCTMVSENDDGSFIYSTTIVPGLNALSGSYMVDEDVDFVDEFKLNISDEVFNTVINYKETGKKDGLDFRRSGIETMGAPMKWSNGKKTKNSDVFVNYVDGDTTHVETSNLQYTVKIRYLSIDTPESTSEIEEWGLSASNYSKYIYTGDASYLSNIRGNAGEDLSQNPAGISSLILVSQDASKNADIMTVADLKIGSTDNGPYMATTDGNQRNLAYVWYSTVENPTKNDFRCLNLEMVYQGFSFGVGSMSATSEYYYKMFDAANLSAQAHGRHLYSDEEDLNYYYYEQLGVQELTLDQLYASAKKDDTIGYYPESPLANKKTLYKVHGYVSRKVGTAFYMQTQPSYTDAEVAAGKALGIYVFTYSETPITPGDEVNVIGAVSVYGGTFQIQGISYSTIGANPNRDTQILSSGHKIEPIKVTGKEFNQKMLPSVLVEITDNVWFYDFSSSYGGEQSSLGEGGSEEINKYNEAYPFYNTSNAPIFYGSYGATDNAAKVDKPTTATGVRYSNDVIRFTVDQNVLVTYGSDTCYSYRFFTGGSYVYNPNGAEYANMDADNPYLADSVLKEYNRKAALPEEAGHGLIVISHGYESTSGKKKMSATICSGRRSDINLVEIA